MAIGGNSNSNVTRSAAPAVLGGRAAFSEPVYITRPLIPEEAEFQARLRAIFASHWLTNDGPMVRALEAALQTQLGVAHCKVLCNGTTALQVALRALDLEGEVITTPFTFPATVHAIEWNGLTPVFCDVDPETYNLDVAHAAALAGAATCALVPVHVFGNPCDGAGIAALAARRGLKVVYDAAHVYGVEQDGEAVCQWGDLSVLSFHATKLFHTCEGGAIIAAEPGLVERIALLRNFGIVSHAEVRGVGLNGKLSELHAAVGLGVLAAVDGEIRARAQLVGRYRELLEDVPGLRMQKWSPATKRNHAYFTLEVDEREFGMSRDVLHDALRAENIFVRRYFHPLCSENESYRNLASARPQNLPNATRLARRILCLPLHGGIGLADVERIAERVTLLQSRAPEVRRAIETSA